MRKHDDFINAYLRYTSTHEGTPKVHKWSCISILAAAMERRCYLPRGFYTLYPNLYVFIIGRSGLIKKSTSTGIAVNLFRELKGPKVMSERVTAGSLIDQMAGAQSKFENNGFVQQQAALFAYASELSVFLSEVFGSIIELLTTFYDCVPNDFSKPWIYKTKGGGETKIFGPCLNILGASTKSWLKRCIPNTEIEGGFTSRVIFVVENAIPINLVAWPEVSIEQENIRYHLVEDLREIYKLKGEFTVEPDAKILFSNWYKNHMTKIVPLNQDPRMCGYMARKGDTILKLAMVKSISQRSDLRITKDDIKWAGGELNELELDMRNAFDGVSGNRLRGLAFELRSFIRNRTKVSKAELIDTYVRLYPAQEVANTLESLIGMDEITLGYELVNGIDEPYYSFSGSDFDLL